MDSNFNSTFRSGTDAPFTATFRIERTASGLDITTLSDSSNGDTITRSTSGFVTSTFNSIAFAHNSDFSVDDIVVNTNIPEPSSLMLLCLAASAFAVIRTRKS